MNNKDLHLRFQEYGKNAKQWLHKCKLLLPEIERKKIWKQQGFLSIYEYAAKLAGLSKASVYEALWVLKKIEDKPALQKVAVEKGISRVRPLISIASKENQNELAQIAKSMSRATLETYVKELKMTESFIPGNKTQPAKVKISLHLEKRHIEKLKQYGDVNKLLEEFIEQLPKKPTVQKPDTKHNAKRHIPSDIRQFVINRTNGQCAFPACNKPYTNLHHAQRFRLDHSHDPDKLHALCTAHERIAHHGLIENEECSPHTWRIRKQPDKTHPAFWIDRQVALYRPG